LAHAYRPGDGGLNGDLHFDISETWTFGSGGGPPYDMMETAAHEIGHAIGLDHESVNPALMVANYAGRYSGSGTGFLLQDDINGIQSLYGSGLGYVMDVFGNMWVGGTSGSNTINVNYNSSTNEITVTSSGFGGFTHSAAGITKLRILGSSGSDVIEVNSVPFTVEVDGGTGTDVLSSLAAVRPTSSRSTATRSPAIPSHLLELRVAGGGGRKCGRPVHRKQRPHDPRHAQRRGRPGPDYAQRAEHEPGSLPDNRQRHH
jgi:hypothetical protein